MYETGQLEPGEYTVVAFKADDVAFGVTSLESVKQLGIPYAEDVLTIYADAINELTINVPDFDQQNEIATMGVKSIRVAPRDESHCDRLRDNHRS